MGDLGDYWRDVKPYIKEDSYSRRKNNRKNSVELLKAKGIIFEIKNDGAHLIVTGTKGLIDFWPGTGKYITRTGMKGRGVFNLLKLCNIGE